MIDPDKQDLLHGTQIIEEYKLQLIIPELTTKEKIISCCQSILELLKEIGWIALATIGMALQVGGIAYIAGLMFFKGAS